MVYKSILLIFFGITLLSCGNGSDLKNQITITVKVIDSQTEQPRVNDTVTIRQAKWGIPRRYVEVGQYVTDSLGKAELKISKVNRYSFETDGSNFAFGSDEYGEGELENHQQVIIKVVSPNRKHLNIE